MAWGQETSTSGGDHPEDLGADEIIELEDGSTEEPESRPEPNGMAAAHAVPADGIRVLCVGSNMLQYGLVGVVREVAGEVDVRWARTVAEAAGRLVRGEGLCL